MRDPSEQRLLSISPASTPRQEEASEEIPAPEVDEDAVEEKHSEADIAFHPGAYTAVIVAAFGGIHFSTGRLLHPFLILLMVAPLFMIQMTMIVALRLDMDFMLGIRMNEHISDLGDVGNPSNLIRVKCLMVFVVQLSCFTIMLSNVRYGVFLLNPLTWLQISHPNGKQWLFPVSQPPKKATMKLPAEPVEIFFHPIFLCTPALIAVACRFFVSYNVCVDSMSIIFGSRSMTDCMFNALVLTFITDLQPIYWEFVSTVFTLNSIENFEFTVRDRVTDLFEHIRKKDWTETEINEELVKLDAHSKTGIVKWVAYYVPVLARGYGFRRVENFIAFAVLGAVYLQQVFLVLFALMTNVLPVTRDMCSLWRWKAGKAAYLKFIGPAFVRFLDAVTFVSLHLDETLANLPDGSCQEPKVGGHVKGIYSRMQSSDKADIASNGAYTYVESIKNGTNGSFFFQFNGTTCVNCSAFNGTKYSIETQLVEDNHWTGFFFKIGVIGVLAVVIVPQTKSIMDVIEKIGEKISGSQAEDAEKSETKAADAITKTQAREIKELKEAVAKLTKKIEALENK